MGIWIEFRCEDRTEEWANGRPNHRCWSNDNAGPMDMASDNMQSIRETVSALSDDARRSGWKKTRNGWICPHCAKARAAGLPTQPEGGERDASC